MKRINCSGTTCRTSKIARTCYGGNSGSGYGIGTNELSGGASVTRPDDTEAAQCYGENRSGIGANELGGRLAPPRCFLGPVESEETDEFIEATTQSRPGSYKPEPVEEEEVIEATTQSRPGSYKPEPVEETTIPYCGGVEGFLCPEGQRCQVDDKDGVYGKGMCIDKEPEPEPYDYEAVLAKYCASNPSVPECLAMYCTSNPSDPKCQGEQQDDQQQRPECPVGEVMGSNGVCQCPAGFEQHPSGVGCICAGGKEKDLFGNCFCPGIEEENAVTGICECPRWSEIEEDGVCRRQPVDCQPWEGDSRLNCLQYNYDIDHGVDRPYYPDMHLDDMVEEQPDIGYTTVQDPDDPTCTYTSAENLLVGGIDLSAICVLVGLPPLPSIDQSLCDKDKTIIINKVLLVLNDGDTSLIGTIIDAFQGDFPDMKDLFELTVDLAMKRTPIDELLRASIQFGAGDFPDSFTSLIGALPGVGGYAEKLLVDSDAIAWLQKKLTFLRLSKETKDKVIDATLMASTFAEMVPSPVTPLLIPLVAIFNSAVMFGRRQWDEAVLNMLMLGFGAMLDRYG